MFEEYTYEKILNDMLDRVPDNLDKRQASIIYNALAPAAVELQNMYINLDTIMNETFADTANRENLIKRASERGLNPYPATKAIVKGVFTPSSLEITIGARFSVENLNYAVTEKITDGQYKLQCEEAGSDANYNLGQLIPINYIEGLQYAQITEILIPGEDEENTEDFRNRYFASFDNQAFGGNITDYKVKTNALPGVGGVKVYPTWNGGGTVKLVITNSEFGIPSSALISSVQTAIDPTQNQGEGIGIAPIGHVVTVAGVTATTLDIDSEFTLQNGYTWLDVKANVEAAIENYFLELNKTWDANTNLIVRISQIETRLLNVEGIIDIANTTIEEVAQNYTLGENAIANLGEVTNSAT